LALEAKLRLGYPGRVAKAIAKAVTPDNLKTPPGLVIETRVEDSNVVVEIYCKRSMESLIATLDDLLACIQAAERAISATEAT